MTENGNARGDGGERHRSGNGGERHRGAGGSEGKSEVVLVTGFPRYLPQRLALEVLERDPRARVVLLVGEDCRQAAADFAGRCGDRLSILVGDPASMDLGLSGSEFRHLSRDVSTIHHLARAPLRGSSRDEIERINVSGARNILRVAADCQPLRRLCMWTSVTVAGKRRGVVLEEDLDHGQSFHNAHEQSLFEAELLARAAMSRLPITVLRPGLVIGDSSSGEYGGDFDGPYYLMSLLATSSRAIPVPIPGSANAPLHIVPVDFVARAGYELGRDARAAGQTYHLTDPNPLPARRAFELVAERSHARLARRSLPTGLAKTLLRAPGLDRLASAPRAFLDRLDQQVFYNSRHATALLADHGVRCPTFDSYVGEIVQFLQSRTVPDTSEHATDTLDPFDPDANRDHA